MFKPHKFFDPQSVGFPFKPSPGAAGGHVAHDGPVVRDIAADHHVAVGAGTRPRPPVITFPSAQTLTSHPSYFTIFSLMFHNFH